jgi:hypothetical protein
VDAWRGARIKALEAQLEQEQHENATLRRLLFTQYARQPRLMRRLNLPISDRAVLLFEVLPETFDLEAVLATAEKLGLEESEAAEHVRTYFQEGMLEDREDGKHFVKTGYRPYLSS